MSIAPFLRLSDLLPLTLDRLKTLLGEYVRETGKTVDLLLVGALALQAYGAEDRATQDLDGELIGELEPLVHYLRAHNVPADLGENISGWSVIAMPPGYRERASILADQPGLKIRLLAPTDFIIAKLRRGTELDLDDALFVARRFGVDTQTVRAAGESAIAASPQDTALFFFRKMLDLFCAKLPA